MYVMKITEEVCSHWFCVKLNLKKYKWNYGMNLAEFLCSFIMTETELLKGKKRPS